VYFRCAKFNVFNFRLVSFDIREVEKELQEYDHMLKEMELNIQARLPKLEMEDNIEINEL
jgi:hypothetical protein